MDAFLDSVAGQEIDSPAAKDMESVAGQQMDTFFLERVAGQQIDSGPVNSSIAIHTAGG